MNNEEKILSILESMQMDLASIHAQQKVANERLANLEAGQKSLEAGQKNLEVRQKNLEARQENLEAGQKSLEAGQKSLEAGQKKLEDGQMTLKARIDHIEELIYSIDAKNATRHIEMQAQIDKLTGARSPRRVK